MKNDYITIDPEVGYGRPCIKGTGIPAQIIWERFTAGESVAALGLDYDRSLTEIQAAIRYVVMNPEPDDELTVINQKLVKALSECLDYICSDCDFGVSLDFEDNDPRKYCCSKHPEACTDLIEFVDELDTAKAFHPQKPAQGCEDGPGIEPDPEVNPLPQNEGDGA